jgi:cytochrome c2
MINPAIFGWHKRTSHQPTNYSLTFLTLLLFALLAGACAGQVNGPPSERSVPQGDAGQGKDLIVQYGCGACHTISGVLGAHAQVGPPLTNYYERDYVAGLLPNTWENLTKWIEDPQHIKPGTAMPNLGVSDPEARHIAAYLYKQPNILDILSR